MSSVALEGAIPIDRLARRLPSWRTRQRDTSCCQLCDGAKPTAGQASMHVYQKHLQQPILRCAICQVGFYRSDSARVHLKAMHAGQPAIVVDRRDELETVFLRVFEQCYPLKEAKGTPWHRTASPKIEARADDGPANQKKLAAEVPTDQVVDHGQKPAEKINLNRTWRMLQRNGRFCVLCQRSLPNGRASAHIYKEHIKQLPYKCSSCGYTGSSANSRDVRTHAERAHGEDENKAEMIDLRPELRDQLELWYERCFELKAKFRSPDETSRTRMDCMNGTTATDDNESELEEERMETATETEEISESPALGTPSQELPKHTPVSSGKKLFAAKRLPSWRMRNRDSKWCQLCNCNLKTKSSRIHIYMEHMQTKCFSCGICRRNFYGASQLATHHGRVHRGEQMQIIDKRDTVEPQFLQLFDECFALKNTK